MTMDKICICSFSKDGLNFIEGCSYKITYNKIDNRIYVYNVYGYTDISKSSLNLFFL